jgi:hypothetical protein
MVGREGLDAFWRAAECLRDGDSLAHPVQDQQPVVTALAVEDVVGAVSPVESPRVDTNALDPNDPSAQRMRFASLTPAC